jgi:hypothetical protein
MSEQRSLVPEEPPAWALGFILFGALLMIMGGVFQALAGLIAIFEDDFYAATRNYLLEFDVTTWGWIHLTIGVVAVLAGAALFSGATWARIVAITLAVLSAIANFGFIPYYPIWSILIIVVNVFVIWALAVYGGRLQA